MKAQSTLETAKTCCLGILKRAADAKSWADGEAVIQVGLIPLGDAILGLGSFLDALPESEAAGFRKSSGFKSFESLCRTQAVVWLESLRGLPETVVWFVSTNVAW